MLPVFTVVDFRIDDIKVARVNAVETEDGRREGKVLGRLPVLSTNTSFKSNALPSSRADFCRQSLKSPAIIKGLSGLMWRST